MSELLIEPTMGYIVTPVTYDGTNFHPLLSTVAGLLQVSVEAATEIVTRCMGYDGGAWVAMHVDAAGDMQADILTIAEGQIKCYGYDGGAWRRLLVDAAGHQQNDILTIVDGQIRGYNWDGAAWQKVKGLATGIAQVDVDSLRDWDDTIPMNYHDQWRARTSYLVDAGQDFVDSAVVPADHVAVVTIVTAYTTSGTTTQTVLMVMGNAQTTVFLREYAPAAYVPLIWQGHLYLKAGDYIRFDTTSCPIGQTVYLDVLGYYMRIA